MDEKNFIKDEGERREKNLAQEKKNESRMSFVWGLLIILVPYILLFIAFRLYTGYGILGGFMLAILFSLIGFIIWLILRITYNNRSLALGLLIGGLIPFLGMFIFTGGCGLFWRV